MTDTDTELERLAREADMHAMLDAWRAFLSASPSVSDVREIDIARMAFFSGFDAGYDVAVAREREAGRREGLREAAKIARGYHYSDSHGVVTTAANVAEIFDQRAAGGT